MDETAADRLVLGSGGCERVLDGVVQLLDSYTNDDGTRFLEHQPIAPPYVLLPEDLAVTILLNARVAPEAFRSVADRTRALDLARLPDVGLEDTTPGQREAIVEVVATVAAWPGFACSVATKVLHKKRPALIPLLDSQAIFGAYLHDTWPARPARTQTVYDRRRIRQAVESIHRDLVREENAAAWQALSARRPERTRVQLFDLVWWSWFLRLEPMARRSAAPV